MHCWGIVYPSRPGSGPGVVEGQGSTLVLWQPHPNPVKREGTKRAQTVVRIKAVSKRGGFEFLLNGGSKSMTASPTQPDASACDWSIRGRDPQGLHRAESHGGLLSNAWDRGYLAQGSTSANFSFQPTQHHKEAGPKGSRQVRVFSRETPTHLGEVSPTETAIVKKMAVALKPSIRQEPLSLIHI